ncbi:tRNA cyclic N6-threonylcarbamoyladenosine(37) synthase TcdA [Halomonas sp. PGE1]|uniref:tRNA cyclic N6-threonylcarbamoyladenosine(37) synthase TcdA n=1 Tax=Halomonas sp. PGE1 TaxID=2730360 RepID=UPI0014737B49|nr:tRNA cyclic N6-threonylcarbamoyladenosine(37) synthase TcdA [Halomonas sp. PGE1]QJQ98033.1 tRNA cyclic N6-threonylcarbamoyladenosine(37) synthase TcdA [Halomonas sp. PGE1]
MTDLPFSSPAVVPQESVDTDDHALRFGGIRRLYGTRAVERFRTAHVVVVGVGGVGSWTVEALARSGIGKLTLIDLDDVCVSNVNRQLHALDGTIGRPKVEVLAERCRAIQPGIEVVEEIAFVTPTNLAERIPEDADHVVDAIDSVVAKAALIAWCKRRKLPITVTGAAGGQTDPTRIRVADLARTEHDPLLAKVRSRLRRDFGFSRNPKRRFSVECVYSDEQLVYPGSDGEVCLQKPGTGEATRLDCASGFGAATFVTGSFGFVAASRVLARLARRAAADTPAS